MKMKPFLIALFFIPAIMISCGKDKPAENRETAEPKFETITMEEAMARMKTEKNFILLDVRRAEEFSEGHIPNAILLSNEKINPKKTETLLKDKQQQIYVYCRSGKRSKEAAGKLAALGYEKVTDIGGILDYKGKQEK